MTLKSIIFLLYHIFYLNICVVELKNASEGIIVSNTGGLFSADLGTSSNNSNEIISFWILFEESLVML